MSPRTSRRIVIGCGLIAYCFLYLPIFMLIAYSFNAGRTDASWSGLTLKWYREALTDRSLIDSFLVSVYVAATSTALATALGTLAAVAIDRGRFPGRSLLRSALLLPVGLPDIAFAVSMLSFFVLIDLTLGTVSIILAHTTANVAYVAIVVSARLRQLDPALESAAMDLGATPLQSFRRVTLPLLRPGMIGGALLAFALSWDDFVVSFFTAGVGATTLPLKVYSMVKFGVSPKINAISSLMMVTSLLILLAGQYVLRPGRTIRSRDERALAAFPDSMRTESTR